MVNRLVIVLRIEFNFILDPSVPCIKQLVVATHAVGFSNAYGGGIPILSVTVPECATQTDQNRWPIDA